MKAENMVSLEVLVMPSVNSLHLQELRKRWRIFYISWTAILNSDEDDFLYELTEGMRHYEDEESFLSAWGDKTSYLEFIAFKSLRGFIASYPETISLEKDEDDYDQDLEIDSWYDDVALPKLDPFLIAIKDQFEQHQQKKA
jgi:hypothetical protein